MRLQSPGRPFSADVGVRELRHAESIYTFLQLFESNFLVGSTKKFWSGPWTVSQTLYEVFAGCGWWVIVSQIAGVTVWYVAKFWAHQIELDGSYKMSPEHRNKPHSNVIPWDVPLSAPLLTEFESGILWTQWFSSNCPKCPSVILFHCTFEWCCFQISNAGRKIKFARKGFGFWFVKPPHS